ncbi:MAG: hypothetical protein V1863_03400 [Candidatus Omnitrophota bacterium]
MKKSFFLLVLGVLVGAAIFGFVKSIELWKKNLDLSQETDVLNVKLAATQIALKENQKQISARDSQNVQLTDEIEVLESRLAKKIREAQEYIKNNAELSAKLGEASVVNTALTQENKVVGNHLMRLALENSDMKRMLSSVQELKEAIRELKIKQSKRSEQQPVSAKKPTLPQILEVPDIGQEATIKDSKGNRGFLVKDGETTFVEFVDIRVTSVESSGL